MPASAIVSTPFGHVAPKGLTWRPSSAIPRENMLFTSYRFFLFLPVVVLIRWLLPARAVRHWCLLASYLFYLSAGPLLGLLLFALTGGSFWAARRIEGSANHKKTVLALSVTVLLGMLGVFKYSGFLSLQFGQLMLWLDLPACVPDFSLVLPLGISFYAFQILSYLVDVYRGRPAERSFSNFALYVSFFPTVASGPICRADELLPQLSQPKPLDGELFGQSAFLLLQGLIKKTVFADNLALWVQVAFREPQGLPTWQLWLAVLAFAGQIYCDFSGYTDMARGSAGLLGFNIPDNFDFPYLASSPREFWRRWHMTLSRWLRDYLYIPLGGNRKGNRRTYSNLLLTMGLGGLWHGPAWGFLLWGLFHGGLLCLHRLWTGVVSGRLSKLRDHIVYRTGAVLVTFTAVMLGWVLFRATSLSQALALWVRLFKVGSDRPFPTELKIVLPLLGLLIVGHCSGRFHWLELCHQRLAPALRGLTWACMLALVYWFAAAPQSFIYARF